MNIARGLWASVQSDPAFMRRFNGWATVIWFALAIPICIFLKDSVPVLVFISVYANVVGHLSSWQASRVEELQQKAEQEQESKEEAHDEKLIKKIDEITPDA